jgi:hypothetical protein
MLVFMLGYGLVEVPTQGQDEKTKTNSAQSINRIKGSLGTFYPFILVFMLGYGLVEF